MGSIGKGYFLKDFGNGLFLEIHFVNAKQPLSSLGKSTELFLIYLQSLVNFSNVAGE